jgi:hypothetical protein
MLNCGLPALIIFTERRPKIDNGVKDAALANKDQSKAKQGRKHQKQDYTTLFGLSTF